MSVLIAVNVSQPSSTPFLKRQTWVCVFLKTSVCHVPVDHGPGAARCPRGTCCDGRAGQAALGVPRKCVGTELECRRGAAGAAA